MAETTTARTGTGTGTATNAPGKGLLNRERTQFIAAAKAQGKAIANWATFLHTYLETHGMGLDDLPEEVAPILRAFPRQTGNGGK